MREVIEMTDEVRTKGKSKNESVPLKQITKPRTMRSGHKRAKETFEPSDKLFHALIQNASDAIIVINPELNISYESPSMERLTGRRTNSRIGKNPLEFCHPDDIEKLTEEFIKLLENKISHVNMKIRLQHKDGGWPTFELVGTNLIDDPEVAGIVLNLRDISERQQAENQIRKNEEKYRTLVETMNDGLAVIDKDFILTYVNDKLCEMTGYSRDGIVGQSALKLMSEATVDGVNPDIFREEVRKRREGGRGSYEMEITRKDGSRIIVNISPQLITDIEGNIDGSFGVITDITERKRAEEALRESQEKLRTVFDSIGDGITVLDLAGNIVDVNETVLRIKGYDREDVIGRFGLDFVAEKDHARATEGIMGLFSGEVEQTPGTEYALLAKDGSEIPCEASASLLRDGAGNVVGLISVERDLTERKKDERRLRENEEQYRMLVETSPHGIQENDISGLITFSNKAHHEMNGYAEGEIKGKYIWDLLVTNHDKEELQAYFAKLVSEQPLPVPYFVKNRTKDGRVIEVQVDWNYMHDEQGQLVGFVSIITDITERKRVEQRLQESEDLLKRAEKLAGTGSWQWNLRSNKFVISDGMRLLYGTERKEFTDFKDIVETLVHPDDREEVYKVAERVADKGFGETLTYRVIRPDGEVRWINATIPEVRRFGEDGKLEIMVGAVQDITQRKRDERQLKEREERWKLFSESATDVFTIWDSKLNLIDNSEKGIQTFFPPGTRKDDLIGKNMTEFIPDEEKAGRYQDYLNVIKTGKPYFAEDIVPHHKFGNRQVSVKAFKVGEGLGTIVTDITEKKQAEHQLQESEERLRSFMESATDTFNIWDSNLDLIYTTEKGLKEFFPPGTKKEDMLGKNITELAPGIRETGRYDEYLKVLETGKPFFADDVVPSLTLGNRYITQRAFKTGDGLGMITTDTTERKKAEDELRLYSERIRAMTKQLSGLEEYERRGIARELHDHVGQNLTVLGINFSRAKTQMTEGKIEEVQSILDDSQGLVEQTTAVIRDIMANLRPPVLEDYGLLAALRWHGDRFASRTGIAISVKGKEPAPRLGIDLEIVLFRIAQEALLNIAKHANANHVTVKYNVWYGKVRLLITDDGIGFNVAEVSSSAKHSGWGMVTMSERAQSISGSLCVESNPGDGTQIIVEVVR